MSIFSKPNKSELVESTSFSEFIRNAPSKEKKRVYSHVLKKATEMQTDLIKRVRPVAK